MSKFKFIIFLFIYFIFSKSVILADSNTKLFVNIDSPAAVVIDNETGRVLYNKNADEKRPMASLTKVMTSILLVENCKMDEMIEVPKGAASIGGSTVGLKKGDMVSAESLLYAERSRMTVDLLCEPHGIDGFDQRHLADDALHLVCLEVSDQVYVCFFAQRVVL